MSEKPILFNTEMVKAILDGRKTATRRIIKPAPMGMTYENGCPARTPPVEPGDILWVRETWASWSPTYGTVPHFIYKADETETRHKVKWHPSIHMPRRAARIFLLVKNVRGERLRDILGSAQAIQAEGVKSTTFPSILFEFKNLWNSTIKPADLPRYGWDANPWVWVIEFEREWRNNPWK